MGFGRILSAKMDEDICACASRNWTVFTGRGKDVWAFVNRTTREQTGAVKVHWSKPTKDTWAVRGQTRRVQCVQKLCSEQDNYCFFCLSIEENSIRKKIGIGTVPRNGPKPLLRTLKFTPGCNNSLHPVLI